MYIYLMFIIQHFLCDWILQSREVAKNKSKDFGDLLEHLSWVYLGSYSVFLFCAEASGLETLAFPLLYTFLHGLQDWFIWRFYGWIRGLGEKSTLTEFHYWEDKLWFDFIALDQTLHLTIGFILIWLASI